MRKRGIKNDYVDTMIHYGQTFAHTEKRFESARITYQIDLVFLSPGDHFIGVTFAIMDYTD